MKALLEEELKKLYNMKINGCFIFGELKNIVFTELPRTYEPPPNITIKELAGCYKKIIEKCGSYHDGMHGIELDGLVKFWSAKIYTRPVDRMKYPKDIGTREATIIELLEDSDLVIYNINSRGVIRYNKMNIKTIYL